MLKSLTLSAAIALALAAPAAHAQKGKAAAKGKAPAPTAAVGGGTKTNIAASVVEVVKPGGATKMKIGDIFQGHVTVLDPTGKVLSTTRQQGPVTIQLRESAFRGDLNDCMTALGTGDSAMVNIPADSLLKGVPPAQRPPSFPSGSTVRFGVQVISATNGAEYDKKQEADLLAYAKANKLEVKKTASGLMYAITTPGVGNNIKANDKADVHYTGKLLDGSVFDSSIPRGQTFNLTVGTGSVIKGWDEGLTYFNKGAKGVLLIPYQMAYGEGGSPPKIPGFAPLIFEIEVTNIESK